MSRADATDGRGRKKGRGEAEEVPQEETGWLDDLRGAKQAKDQFDDSDFTDGGSSRWDKLSALSDDAPAESPNGCLVRTSPAWAVVAQLTERLVGTRWLTP